MLFVLPARCEYAGSSAGAPIGFSNGAGRRGRVLPFSLGVVDALVGAVKRPAVSKSWRTGATGFHALADVDPAVEHGSLVAVMGRRARVDGANDRRQSRRTGERRGSDRQPHALSMSNDDEAQLRHRSSYRASTRTAANLQPEQSLGGIQKTRRDPSHRLPHPVIGLPNNSRPSTTSAPRPIRSRRSSVHPLGFVA